MQAVKKDYDNNSYSETHRNTIKGTITDDTKQLKEQIHKKIEHTKFRIYQMILPNVYERRIDTVSY